MDLFESIYPGRMKNQVDQILGNLLTYSHHVVEDEVLIVYYIAANKMDFGSHEYPFSDFYSWVEQHAKDSGAPVFNMQTEDGVLAFNYDIYTAHCLEELVVQFWNENRQVA